MPRNVTLMRQHNTGRCEINLFEICHAEADYRAYRVTTRIGRYGRGSIDPLGEPVTVHFEEGTYLGGLALADAAYRAYRRAYATAPQADGPGDPLRRSETER